MDNRERIIVAAAGLFRTYGIKSVTMDSIASHLGISKRTIYELFADKDELLGGVLSWMNEKQKELLSRILSESENAIVAIFRLISMNRDHFQSMSPAFQADLRKYYFDLKNTGKENMPDFHNHQQIIEKGISEELFRDDIDPDLANRCLYSMGRSIMDYELYPDQFSRNEVLSNTIINYLKGISTQKGLDLIKSLEKNVNRIS
jgi:TetR/AcrR family transcriptional regulator, cholesterol catabolism regulator